MEGRAGQAGGEEEMREERRNDKRREIHNSLITLIHGPAECAFSKPGSETFLNRGKGR